MSSQRYYLKICNQMQITEENQIQLWLAAINQILIAYYEQRRIFVPYFCLKGLTPLLTNFQIHLMPQQHHKKSHKHKIKVCKSSLPQRAMTKIYICSCSIFLVFGNTISYPYQKKFFLLKEKEEILVLFCIVWSLDLKASFYTQNIHIQLSKKASHI